MSDAVEGGGGDPRELVVRVLKGAVHAGASDIHLKAGAPPRVRIDGKVCPLDMPGVDEGTMQGMIGALASAARVAPERLAGKQIDFSCAVGDVGRFRVHAYRQAGTVAAALRYIPFQVPDFVNLRIPPVVKRIVASERGLILVTGATGNGKSTTIASMLDYINAKLPRHVVTIEDPIEFIFSDQVACFTQREVGRDVDHFEQGLVGALREDPDVVFVGEVRTPQEFDIALAAAESGRLVMTTFHSADVEKAISRMVGFYPEGYRDGIRARLADILVGIVSQRLVPKNQATQKILVTEVLTRAPMVMECIRDPNRARGMAAALEAGTSEYGCHSFEQTLRSLVKDKHISLDTAKANARSATDFARSMNLTR